MTVRRVPPLEICIFQREAKASVAHRRPRVCTPRRASHRAEVLSEQRRQDVVDSHAPRKKVGSNETTICSNIEQHAIRYQN